METVRKYDMMVVGELNIDLILDQLFTHPQFGKEQRANEMKLTMGSSTAIGAGDSFNAGFIHEFLNGKNLDECLATGSLVAAVSTTEAGGTEAIKSFQEVIEIGNSFKFLTS